MDFKEFQSLNYEDQLSLLSLSGKLRSAFTLEEYQFTLYEFNDFYIELKRKLSEAYFEKIITMHFEDLPFIYKAHC